PEGPSLAAGYDPPFTPGFLRRNEVLIPVSAPQ
ncbi:MAG: heme-binding protein, partial [Gemmatimonadetes bacterium]|nr:heme-binding protein [Gemmatimonadota bacterium]